MTIEVITRSTFASELGLITGENEVSERGLADLLRLPLERWGLSARSAVTRYAREQLEAAGLRKEASPLVPDVLDRLIRLSECEEVRIGHERYITPTQPRWITIGHEIAALLSVGRIPDGVVELPSSGGQDVIRRIHVRNNDDLAALRIAGVRQTNIEEWLEPIGYSHHMARRTKRILRSDELSLLSFWDILVATLVNDGLPLGNEAEVRAVTGKPGAFFGRYDSERCEGRWTDAAADGIWCAYRRGYGQSHWHPVIVEVHGDQRRSLDLFNADEWRWALLARARWSGVDEQIVREVSQVRLSFRAPDQLSSAMDLLGPRNGPWSWTAYPGAPDLWTRVT